MNASRNASQAAVCAGGGAATVAGGSGSDRQPSNSAARAAQARNGDFMGVSGVARTPITARGGVCVNCSPMAASPPAVPTLSRTLRSRHVALISIGGIIGAGLFVGSSANIASVGPAVLVSYVVAGALMFLVMRMLAEMAAANPHALSFADHARAGLGEWAGFACGWLYWYFWVIVVGVEAIAGAAILKTWIPLEVWEIGLALMVLLTATNLLSTRSYGEFEFWFASIKVAAIVAFIVVAGSYALGLTSPAGSTLGNL